MESNREEATRCLAIAQNTFPQLTTLARASLQVCAKSISLFETPEAVRLLAAINTAAAASSAMVVRRVRACKVTEYYEILSVKQDCEEAKIKKAYRKVRLVFTTLLLYLPVLKQRQRDRDISVAFF